MHRRADTPQAENQFQVVEQTSIRNDLARRREVKYAIHGADVQKLRGHLAMNCRRQIHNHQVSTVRSIYFDDSRMSAAHANVNGDGSRRKLRLRWYDTPLPERNAYLEVKWRDGLITGKHRMQLESPTNLHELSYFQIAEGLGRAAPEKFQLYLYRYSEPVVMVRYQREHFISDDGTLRMTLDYDLTYCDQTGRQFISTDFGCQLDGLVVLEGKVPVGREAELRRLLYPFSPRANRCSKYVHGCRLLGHIRGID